MEIEQRFIFSLVFIVNLVKGVIVNIILFREWKGCFFIRSNLLEIFFVIGIIKIFFIFVLENVILYGILEFELIVISEIVILLVIRVKVNLVDLDINLTVFAN